MGKCSCCGAAGKTVVGCDCKGKCGPKSHVCKNRKVVRPMADRQPPTLPIDEQDGDFQIFVQLPAGATITLNVEPQYTIDHVKAMIKNVTGIPKRSQKLYYLGIHVVAGSMAWMEAQEGTILTLVHN
jgi:hypothetical protein